MLKRIFKSNRVFSGLFVISFVAVFMLMYFGLYLYKQIDIVDKGRYNYSYITNYQFSPKDIDDYDTHYIDYSEIKIGNIIERISLPIGEESGGRKGIYFLAVQNEELSETMSGGRSIPIIGQSATPQCVIGDQWESKTINMGGEKYIRLLNTYVRVIGIFDQVTIKGTDNRILVFGSTIDDDTRLEWFNVTGQVTHQTVYQSNMKENELEKVKTLAEKEFGKDNVRILPELNLDAVQGVAKTYIPLMKVFLIIASILCLITMFFLVSVWSRTHTFEFMLKRAMGYKISMFIPEILKTLLIYEIPAFIVTMIVTFIYELTVNDVKTWINNISGGLYIIIIVFAAVVFLLSVVPLKWISKEHPSDYVSSRE